MVPSLSTPATPAAPLEDSERVGALDVLRGVAVLGIFVMNVRNLGLGLTDFDNPAVPSGVATPANTWVWAVSNILFEDKMIAIFSMLFGVGIVVMSGRVAARGLNAAALHYRRMVWLLVIGLLHAYGLWYGDILNTYALCGMICYPLRRLPPALLLGLGVLMLVVTVGFRAAPGFYDFLHAPAPPPGATQTVSPPTAAPQPAPAESRTAGIWRESVRDEPKAQQGGYLTLFRWRARLNTLWHFDSFWNFSFWRSAGYMLVGMALWRLRVLDASRPASFYTGMAIAAYSAGLTLFLLGFSPQLARVLGHDIPIETRRALGLLAWPARFLGSSAIALGHVAMVLLACRAPALAPILAPLRAAGRMALTNYLMQTVIAVLIFDGWAGGQWSRWDMFRLALLVVGVWCLQLVLSPLWLRAFNFGPVEWLWRSLTYRRWQPMRRGSSPPAGNTPPWVARAPSPSDPAPNHANPARPPPRAHTDGMTRALPSARRSTHLPTDVTTKDAASPDLVKEAAARARAMLRAGVPQREVLASLATAAEQLAGPGSVCSILLLDGEGLLRDGASPNLPADYLAAIDRLKPDANLGTCAAAAATGCMVVTPDFLTDDKWAELRHLPLSLGFVAAWSLPIKSGPRVLGTFGTYFREKRRPTLTEIDGVAVLAEAAALALV